jgi:branched-chain amino acid transport system permease protein
VLYSLVALGFVLIFKASGVFNFAQGAMVLFAALSLARLSEMDPARTGARAGRSAARLRGALSVGVMVAVLRGDRAAGAAPAGQPGGHHRC